MASSDDEGETVPQTVSNYHFVDENEEPISFALLPNQWSVGESPDGNKKQIFLHGTADGGLQKLFKQVTAWKFDLSNVKPEIWVLTKENNWIKLQKPRKSFEVIIRTILITIDCLHYLKKNPEASEKYLWDHLAKVFSFYEVRPSENDLIGHMPIISEATKREESLKSCKFLLTYLEEKPRKRKTFDEVVQPAFIVDDLDDIIDYPEDGESDGEDDIYDSVCAFCDNGGELLCCEGKCMRSFHATKKAGEESLCVSLRMTDEEVEAIQNFKCKNCEHDQHQCFACGKLGPSDKSAGAEVFLCANATCGYFYHSQCVAKLLRRESEDAAEKLQKEISSGEPFICPVHKCCVCKDIENKKDPEMQFAMCRRCPKSYHKKCLPRKIAFEDLEEEDIETRAWEGLLPNRILIYCLKHQIDEEIGTPIRNHIKFPYDEENKLSRASDMSLGREKGTLKRRSASPRERTDMRAPRQVEKSSSAVREGSSTKKIEKRPPGLDPFKKSKVKDDFKKPLKDNNKSLLAKVEKNSTPGENKVTLGDRLYALTSKKPIQQDMDDGDHDQVGTPKPIRKKMSSSSYQLDADSERRLLTMMKESTSSITLEKIMEKHKAPSTYAYSSKNVVDKTITQGKVEGAVEALRTALQKLEAGCSIEDAKAVCGPEILFQLVKWKNKLKVYLAPFIHGMRYTSFGRHFTKVDKLEEIVDKLHWYVQNGDTIVDFCCGANDFSCLMKRKLEKMGKKCSYKNFDIFPAQNDSDFEQRDWMGVEPRELPTGSQLIMGLNPPFGFKAALANKFIDKALTFKPKLLILIVPPETERLDKKRTPYDLIWEDEELLSGKSFYLPGSVDDNGKQMDQWNNETPPLYLWSRNDWTAKHKAIAQKQCHLSRVQKQLVTQVSNHLMEDHGGNGDIPMLKDDQPVHNDEPHALKRKATVTEGHRQSSAHNNGDNSMLKDDHPVRDEPQAPKRKSTVTEGHRQRSAHNKCDTPMLKDNHPVRKDEPQALKRKATMTEGHRQSSPHNNGNIPMLKDDHPVRKDEPQALKRKATMTEGHRQSSPHYNGDREGRENHSHGKNQSNENSNKRRRGSGQHNRGTSEVSPNDRQSGGRTPMGEVYRGMPHHSPPDVNNARSSLEGRPSYSHDMTMDMDIGEDTSHPFQPISGSGVQFETGFHAIFDDVARKYSLNTEQPYSSRINGWSSGVSPGVDSSGYRPYINEDERYTRDADLRAQVHQFGRQGHYTLTHRSYQVGHDSGFSQLSSSSSAYGQPGSTTDSAYMRSTPKMQQYAPRLDEMNHTRMNSSGRDPSMGTGMSFYDPQPPVPRVRVDSIGFAPGPPHHTFSHQNSSGRDPSMGTGMSFYDPQPPVPRVRVDSIGFAPGPPHHTFSHQNSSGWLNE